MPAAESTPTSLDDLPETQRDALARASRLTYHALHLSTRTFPDNSQVHPKVAAALVRKGLFVWINDRRSILLSETGHTLAAPIRERDRALTWARVERLRQRENRRRLGVAVDRAHLSVVPDTTEDQP